MLGLGKLGITVLAVLTMAAMAPAQVTVSEDLLQQGQQVTISITETSKAGQSVLLYIEDFSEPANPKTQTIEVALDSDGNGTATWTVAAWELVAFRVVGIGEATRVILP